MINSPGRGTAVRVCLGLAIVLIVVGGPLLYRMSVSTRYRNLRVVEEGVLYRSGKLSADALERVIREYQIGTIVNLRDTRDEQGLPDDQYEVDLCAQNGVGFFRLSPDQQTFTSLTSILNDPNTKKPVLVHCFAGIHRTGTQVAVYRMDANGWTAEEAIREMKSLGTSRTRFADQLLEDLQRYRPQRDSR
jgi:protein tyrosine/serine phosphatase